MLVGNFHFSKATGCRGTNCGDNLSNVGLDECPPPFTQGHNRNLTPGKVLLISKIAVRVTITFKASGFGGREEIAVFPILPSHAPGLR